jgi:protocatechuate 3,4-dioxygenase beta subunit
MKKLLFSLCFTCFLFANYSILAQETSNDLDNTSENFIKRSPIYDYGDIQLNNIDTIPGFESKMNKLKISGVIYENDGVTPAKDIIMFIEQADENGDFNLKKHNDKRYVHHRGWIKTDADGHYTFYTFIPGNDRRYNQLQQLFPVIKEPSKPEYEIASFLFDEDPLLSKSCRKKIVKKDDPTRILKLKKEDQLFVTQKDIVLN